MKEQFVQFVVQQFLENQSSNLAEFRRKMVALSLPDERCSLMMEELETFTESLLENYMWRCEYFLLLPPLHHTKCWDY